MKYTVEIIAVLFSIISVGLAVKKSIHNWTTGIVGVVAYGIIFWQEQLYANLSLQLIFIVQSIYGYVKWKKSKEDNLTDDEKISFLPWGGLFLVSWWFFESTRNPHPFLDSLATVLSLGGMYYMIHRKALCWKWWIAADIVYVVLFLVCHLYLSACLYIIFGLIAWEGWRNWSQRMTVEVYDCEDGSTTVVEENNQNKAMLLGNDPFLIARIKGKNWDDCMKKYHKLMGWEPYKPFKKND